MAVFTKKKKTTETHRQIDELKEELRSCERLMRRNQAMFEMTVDDSLIEARIYEMKSLAKHHDYLLKSLRRLMQTEQDQTVNV